MRESLVSHAQKDREFGSLIVHSLVTVAIAGWCTGLFSTLQLTHISIVLQFVAVCCSVLQCVAVCCSVLQCVAVCCSVLQCVAACCSVLLYHPIETHTRCVAVCCIVL